MNMLRRSIFGLLLTCGAITAATLPSSAVESSSTRHLHLLTAFRPLHSKTVPFTGIMNLTIDPSGIINGTYRSTSVRPDPFSNRINHVTGGVSGNDVNFRIGVTLSFNGKRENGEWRGTATSRGRLFSFVAKPASGQAASTL